MKFFQMNKKAKISDFELKQLRYLIQSTIDKKGSQYPNPAVGAMVIKNSFVISEGYHILHGESHAEVEALRKAGKKTIGATMLITLEPCIHKGKTPPCVDAIIKAKIARVC